MYSKLGNYAEATKILDSHSLTLRKRDLKMHTKVADKYFDPRIARLNISKLRLKLQQGNLED